MTEFVALPLVLALGAALAATSVHARLRADVAARMTAVVLVVVMTAALPTLWLMGASGLRHLGVRSPFTDWSSHLLPSFGFAGAIVGSVAFGLMVVGVIRLVRVLRSHRGLRSVASTGVEIVPSAAAFAYTLPGPGENIVVSDGMVALLGDDEYRAVIAHERAHARLRHDRYLLLGRVATALVPFVGPLSSRLEFSLERWADDQAALAVDDRRLVARAIARVASSGSHPSAAVAGIARLGAAARARALLAPVPQPVPAHPMVAAAGFALVATITSVALQLHHTVEFGVSLFG